MQPPEIGSCNDDLTICPVCGDGFRRVGRRRFCDDACRQEAWRIVRRRALRKRRQAQPGQTVLDAAD